MLSKCRHICFGWFYFWNKIIIFTYGCQISASIFGNSRFIFICCCVTKLENTSWIFKVIWEIYNLKFFGKIFYVGFQKNRNHACRDLAASLIYLVWKTEGETQPNRKLHLLSFPTDLCLRWEASLHPIFLYNNYNYRFRPPPPVKCGREFLKQNVDLCCGPLQRFFFASFYWRVGSNTARMIIKGTV
jgi:hypothetical protein